MFKVPLGRINKKFVKIKHNSKAAELGPLTQKVTCIIHESGTLVNPWLNVTRLLPKVSEFFPTFIELRVTVTQANWDPKLTELYVVRKWSQTLPSLRFPSRKKRDCEQFGPYLSIFNIGWAIFSIRDLLKYDVTLRMYSSFHVLLSESDNWSKKLEFMRVTANASS